MTIQQETWPQYVPYYLELKQKLEKAAWFGDGWLYDAWENTPFSTASGQLYKAHWYNQNKNGIHFDCWISEKEVETRKISIALHAHKDFPKAREFIKLFAQRVTPLVADWKDCSLSETSPRQPLIITTRYTPDTLVSQLEQNYQRIQALGPLIDQTIADVLA